MKRIEFTILFSIFICGFSFSQESNSKYAEQVKTIDTTLETLYGVISGEKGEKRNWELFNYLFHPNARLIPSGKNQAGQIGATFMTPQDYIERSGPWLVNNGFFEVEINRETDTFGNITQVFSTYESYRSKSDTAPFMRGINSIQLLYDGTRYWVLNIYWMQESPEHPIPSQYLPKG